MQSLLGIDFGTKRIGIARSIGSFAEPVGIIANTPNAISEISQLCSKYQTTKIIMGISAQQSAQRTKQFSTLLEKKLHLPIEFQDESYSSVIVEEKLRQPGVKPAKRHQHIDHLAASEILQEWLDTH